MELTQDVVQFIEKLCRGVSEDDDDDDDDVVTIFREFEDFICPLSGLNNG